MPTTDIMDMLPISDVSYLPQWSQEVSQGAVPRTADLGEELWVAEVGCSTLLAAEAREAEARINALRGAQGTFYLHNPRAPYPLADLNGATLGESEVTIYALGDDNKSLRFEGLTVGYVLSIGDFFHFDTGEEPNVRRCLHQLTTTGVADGAGRTGMISVVPHIRAGAETAEVFIVPGTFKGQSQRGGLGSITFTAMQVP
jgi:hypothetical protein